MARLNDLKALPSGEHWAILREQSVTIPGDARSRQAPGHGYPERTESYISYEPFTSEAAMLRALNHELKKLSSGWNIVRGIHVTELFAGRTVVDRVIDRFGTE